MPHPRLLTLLQINSDLYDAWNHNDAIIYQCVTKNRKLAWKHFLSGQNTTQILTVSFPGSRMLMLLLNKWVGVLGGAFTFLTLWAVVRGLTETAPCFGVATGGMFLNTVAFPGTACAVRPPGTSWGPDKIRFKTDKKQELSWHTTINAFRVLVWYSTENMNYT